MSEWGGIPEEYRNRIVIGDARELAKRLPDESVDLIYTDPPYPNEFNHVWFEMGEYAPRILKDGGSLITLCGHYQLPLVMDALARLDFQWIGFIDHRTSATVYGYWIIACGKPQLWYTKGKRKINRKRSPFIDLKRPKVGADKRWHKWGQSIDYVLQDLWSLTDEESIILDPYCGGANLPAACKMLRRNYVAFEIDPEVAEKARERVRLTQPPLFVPQPEQMEIWKWK